MSSPSTSGRGIEGQEADGSKRSNVMQVEGDPASREQLLAALTAEGLFTNALLMKSFSAQMAGEIGITEAVKALRATITEVNRGDLHAADTILMSQAGALNAMFAELARRAGAHMGVNLDAADRYMRLALKAQTQCRATLETLANIKSPSVVFAGQANINNGGQQLVTNGIATVNGAGAGAQAGKRDSPPNRLLEAQDGERLDFRAQGPAGRANQDLAAVAQINRAEDRGR